MRDDKVAVRTFSYEVLKRVALAKGGPFRCGQLRGLVAAHEALLVLLNFEITPGPALVRQPRPTRKSAALYPALDRTHTNTVARGDFAFREPALDFGLRLHDDSFVVVSSH